MTTADKTGATTFATPSDLEIEVTRVLRRAARARLRRVDEARAHHAMDARPAGLDDAGLRGRSARGRRLALRLAHSATAARWTCAASTARSPRRSASSRPSAGAATGPRRSTRSTCSEDDGRTTVTRRRSSPPRKPATPPSARAWRGHDRELRPPRRLPGLRHACLVAPEPAPAGALVGHVHDAVRRALGAVVRAREVALRGRRPRRRACSPAPASRAGRARRGSASTPSPPGAPSGRGQQPRRRCAARVSSRSCQKHRCPAIAPDVGQRQPVAPGRVGEAARRRARAPTSTRSGPCRGTP